MLLLLISIAAIAFVRVGIHGAIYFNRCGIIIAQFFSGFAILLTTTSVGFSTTVDIFEDDENEAHRGVLNTFYTFCWYAHRMMAAQMKDEIMTEENYHTHFYLVSLSRY